MKRVLRSCLDPLPRLLTTRGLAAIVALVVTGTALSVYEYVESSRVPERAWPKARPAASAADSTRDAGPKCASARCCPAIEVPAAPSSTASPASSTVALPSGSGATLFRPEASTSGS